MTKVTINENQKGLVFVNGKYDKTIGAGKYTLFGGKTVEVLRVNEPVHSVNCELETILADDRLKDSIVAVEVGDQQIALHYVNGILHEVLQRTGKYAFWSETAEHTFRLLDMSKPEIGDDVPRYILEQLPRALCTKVEVADYQKALLYFDNKFQRVLEVGTYYFWSNAAKVTVRMVDTRLTQVNITGQEIMTQDKVALRINLVCSYRITDCVKILTEIDDFAEQLHIAAQMALRSYVGRYKLDDLLANKDEMSAFVTEQLRAKEQELFLEIVDAGIKDIILPGEIRDIMNTVLIAEKKAQASVITRREEVASTRSLLNTAKLMEENQTLYKLKELEYMERICENVGNINLNGSGDMLTQLLGVIGGKGA